VRDGRDARHESRPLRQESKFRRVSELREVIGALQSEAEFEAAVSELGAAGIDRARGHCRVVRRRRCRPGSDWRSVRADAAGDVGFRR
jgi:hypothetical protein